MTELEKRIARHVTVLVVVGGGLFSLYLLPWSAFAKIAPAITALTAVAAVIVAAVGIAIQRNLARKRAA